MKRVRRDLGGVRRRLKMNEKEVEERDIEEEEKEEENFALTRQTDTRVISMTHKYQASAGLPQSSSNKGHRKERLRLGECETQRGFDLESVTQKGFDLAHTHTHTHTHTHLSLIHN